mmetsp:Transcript_32340/g.33624  ORF Transcript_32340/g.33624 Transcript_32340/m.33624 type:complete len:211 (+) Transcript_32340:1095-1727(+)
MVVIITVYYACSSASCLLYKHSLVKSPDCTVIGVNSISYTHTHLRNVISWTHRLYTAYNILSLADGVFVTIKQSSCLICAHSIGVISHTAYLHLVITAWVVYRKAHHIVLTNYRSSLVVVILRSQPLEIVVNIVPIIMVHIRVVQLITLCLSTILVFTDIDYWLNSRVLYHPRITIYIIWLSPQLLSLRISIMSIYIIAIGLCFFSFVVQ